MVIMLKPYYR